MTPRQTREALEELWRRRVEEALHRYYATREKTATTQAEYSGGLMPSPDGSFAMVKAMRAETAALREYRRVLKIFNDLIVGGTAPEEDGR